MNSQQIEQAEATVEDTPLVTSLTKPARRDKGGKAGKRPTPARKRVVKPKQGATKAKKPVSGKRSGSTKQEQLIAMLSRKEGATVDEIVKAFGWQAHTVRGAISGALKKKLGLKIESQKVEDRGRVYRIVA